MKSLFPRAFGAVVTAAPMLMQAYDDLAHPEDRDKRYQAQTEQARGDRLWWADKVRKLRDKAGLKWLLPFSDDPGKKPKGSEPMIEDDPMARYLRPRFIKAYETARDGRLRMDDRPSDPWLSGERQAIERRALIAADAFKRDPEAARGQAMMRPELVDVTGRVAADVHVEMGGVARIEVFSNQPGVSGAVAFDGRMTRVSVGTTGAEAGKAPHIGRGDT